LQLHLDDLPAMPGVSGSVIGWLEDLFASHGVGNAPETIMTQSHDDQLPPTFNRLAWSNLAAQSAEQIALAAAPIVAVIMLGVGEARPGCCKPR
jgi:hypothetical protein